MPEEAVKVPSKEEVETILIEKETEKPFREQLKRLNVNQEKLFAICRSLNNRLKALESLAQEGEEEEY